MSISVGTIGTSGAVIKSFQNLSFSHPDNKNNWTVTIPTAIDPDNTMLLVHGWLPPIGGDRDPKNWMLSHQLTGPTSILTSRYEKVNGGISYRLYVIEYESGIKSIQRGTKTGGGSITINAVNPNKTWVNYLGAISTHHEFVRAHSIRHELNLTSPTNLYFQLDAEVTASYEVVEFI